MFSIVLTLALLLLVAASLVGVAREVRADGYGRRPAPASFHGWGATGAPSAPFRAQLER